MLKKEQKLSPDKVVAIAKKFKEDLSRSTKPHGHLVALASADWEENMPMDDLFCFTHKDFSSVIVDWRPGVPGPVVRSQISIPVTSEP